jgi:hypothetical protein
VLHWKWALSGPAVDTLQLSDGLILKPTTSEGTLQISLCLDNGGPAICKSTSMAVSASVSLRSNHDIDHKIPTPPGRDALGRGLVDPKRRVFAPRFSRK